MAHNKWSANKGVVIGLMEFMDCDEMTAIDALSYCYEHPTMHPAAYVAAIKNKISEHEFDDYVRRASEAAWLLEVKIG